MVHLGKKISELRQKYGYSQIQIAEKIQTAQSNISYWESLEAGPPIEEMIKILSVFGMTMQDFWECAPLTAHEQELLELYRALGDRQRAVLLNVAKEIKR